jgi:hypothetical protein
MPLGPRAEALVVVARALETLDGVTLAQMWVSYGDGLSGWWAVMLIGFTGKKWV